MRRTGADAAAFFGAFDPEIAEWMSMASPLERATVVQELDAALSIDTVESFDDHVYELLQRYDAAPPGSAERRELLVVFRILRVERNRLFRNAETDWPSSAERVIHVRERRPA